MLHEPSIARLKETSIPGANVLGLFQELAQDASELDQESLDMIVGFMDEEDKFAPGTYVPEIHFIVRRVSEDDREPR